MLGKSVCVLFSGKAGVGKTTSANIALKYAVSKGYISIKGSFAARVKEVAKMGFGWDGQKNELGRRLLQNVGETGREYNESIWAKYLIDIVLPASDNYPYEFVFIDDWRFPNELYTIMDNPLYSVYSVRIEAPKREMLKGTPAYSDISETSLDDMVSFDYYIDNAETKEDLEKHIVEIIEDILSKEKYFGGKQ